MKRNIDLIKAILCIFSGADVKAGAPKAALGKHQLWYGRGNRIKIEINKWTVLGFAGGGKGPT